MNLEPLKLTNEASVFKAGQLAAQLLRDDRTTTFRYLPDYTGPAIATSLPREVPELQTTGGALPPFFSGLLPEGRRLQAVREAIKTSLDDELSLLLAVGEDLVGDVQVVPAGTVATRAASAVDDLPELEAVVFAELYAHVLSPRSIDRVSLAGVQDKVSGGMICLPVNRRGSAWILKLNPPEHPHLVANEAFFLSAARCSRMAVAEAHVVHDRSGEPGLLVRRFDRELVRAGAVQQVLAVAQEDACQVLARYPADKYRMSTEQLIVGLAARTGAPVVAARTLLCQFAFAYLTCNGDAHAKNFSILQQAGEWHVSPGYDLPSTHPYGDDTMALPIAGKSREDIGHGDFVALGEACGVPPKATKRVLQELLAAMPRWLDRLGELPFDSHRVHKLRKACEYRAERLRV